MATSSIPRTVTPTQDIPRHEPKPGLVLATIVTCQLMLVLDATVVNIALPKIQLSLHFSSTALSWVVNAYILAFGGLLLLGGRAGDILGRRRMFISGVTLFTVASLLGGFAPDAGFLLASRALQGVGAAMAGPSMLALIVNTFEEGAPRIKALSIFTAVSSAGGSFGLLLGGALTSWGSWRLVMFVNVPIGLGAVIAAARLLRESPKQAGRFDLGGALTSITGMTGLVYAFIHAGASGWGNTTTIGSFGAAAVLLTSFVLIETRAEHPVVPLRLLKDGARARSYLGVLLLPAGMFGMFFFVTQFLQEVLGMSPIRAGLAFLPMTLALFTVSRFTPMLLPRFGARRLLLVGTVMLTSGLLWMSRINPDTHYLSGLFAPMLLFGIGAGLAFSPLTVTILSGLRPQDSGAASGLLQACQQTGGALGLSVLVSVFGSQYHAPSMRPVPHSAEALAEAQKWTHAIGISLLVATVFAFCTIVIAATLKPRAQAPATPSDPSDPSAPTSPAQRPMPVVVEA